MRRVREDIPPSPPASIRPAPAAWRALARAAAEAAGAADDARALRAVLERALEATGAERAFVVAARRRDGRSEPVVLARVSRRADGAEAPSRTVVQRALAAPRPLVCPEGAADPRLADAPSVHALRLRAVVAAPMRRAGHPEAALVLDSAAAPLAADGSGDLLQGFAALASLATREAPRSDPASASAPTGGESRPLVGDAPAFRAALECARRAAATGLAVLVQGESGTGKESLARAIHDASPRAGGPFVALNCAALAEGLVEAELFGAVRGAFTGAERDRPGLLRAAHSGTLFLDEVGDMPLALQPKLLRALQDRRVRAVGAEREAEADVRVVAATHRDLERRAAEGRFREDLYWRLAVVVVRLPPLRERLADLPRLAGHVLDDLAARHGLPRARLTDAALDRLRGHAWPGNVRELEAVLARAVLACGGGAVPAGAIDLGRPASPARRPGDGSLERAMIVDALCAAGEVTSAARRIGWSRQKLYRRMQALGLRARAALEISRREEPREGPPERDPR